jgi:hypothetical protein
VLSDLVILFSLKFDLHYSLTACARSGDGREPIKDTPTAFSRALKHQKDSEIE